VSRRPYLADAAQLMDEAEWIEVVKQLPLILKQKT
jgi:hypothetical protein